MSIKKFDTVKLLADIPEMQLKAGEAGGVLELYDQGSALCVDFHTGNDDDERDVHYVTVLADQVELFESYPSRDDAQPRAPA